jgi:hypothetical protein
MYKTFRIILGIFIILYVFYNRLLRERMPETNLDYVKLSIYTIIFLGKLVLLLITLYKIFFSYKKTHKSKVMSYIEQLLTNPKNPLLLWTNGLISLDAFLKNLTPGYDSYRNYSDFIIDTVAKFLLKYTNSAIFLLITVCIIS